MRTLLIGMLPCLMVVTTIPQVEAGQDDKSALAKKAREILKSNCYVCHGEDGAAEGGMNFILNRQRLVDRKKVIPGNARNSRLYRQVKSGNMPKDDDPLSAADIDILKRWIDAGAPDFNPQVAPRAFISPADVLSFIRRDLEKLNPRRRRFARYFTITHLHNAGLSKDELQTYRHGFSKLVNSLSWGRRVVPPQAIDPQRTVLRIDINDYLWTESTWERILDEYPYGIRYDTPTAKYCYAATDCYLPHVRADWFVARASLPPLYHEVLELPATDLELEKKLLVDVARNLRTDRAARAGFNGSGVSKNNRLIERHDSNLTNGAYWKSYDFRDAANNPRKNLFAHPLGPTGANAFQHDGGEIIFNLPNGLQAYLLVDAKGKRIDKGPLDVVSDPKRPDRAIVTGLSCMSCHVKGMIEKKDQVRDAVLKNLSAFGKAEAETILALYPKEAEFKKLLAEDAARFAQAVKLCGGRVGSTEPIVTLALRFEEELDVKLAAAEVGLTVEDFLKGLDRSPRLGRALGVLKVAGGTVKRTTFIANFKYIIGDLKLGNFVGRLWETATLSLTFKGHSSSVFSVAFSPDGKRLASASYDNTVKVWDVLTGREILTLKGHSSSVTSVAFSPDGNRLASASLDKTVKVWDARRGTALLADPR